MPGSKSDQEFMDTESRSASRDLEAPQEQEQKQEAPQQQDALQEPGVPSQDQDDSQSNTKKSKIQCDDAHRPIFDAAERGDIQQVLEIHKGLSKKRAANKMLFDEYGNDPLLGKVTALVVLLVVLYREMNALYERLKQLQPEKDSQPFSMNPKAVELLENKLEPLKDLFVAYEIESPDKDGKHPLHGGEKKPFECVKELFSILVKLDSCFLEMQRYIENVCARVDKKAAKVAKKKPSENTGSLWDCFFPWNKRKAKTAALTTEIESATRVGADSQSSSSNGSQPSPSSSANSTKVFTK